MTLIDRAMTEERILLWGNVVYLGLWRAWLKKIVMFFYTWKMGQLSAILAPAPSFPLAVHTDPGGMRTRCGTKHSISASDITAVSSAVSACAINSVAERADCLCRKYLTPDPKPWEIDFFFLHGSVDLDFCQCINHEIWVFVHARLSVVRLSPCRVFCEKVWWSILCSVVNLWSLTKL